MIHESDSPPAEVVDAVVAIAHRIVWCSMATVDRRGRPRSGILHPLWERVDGALVGHVFTRPTPLKLAHLSSSPYVTCSYWDATHDVAIADCRAEWVDEPAARHHAWELFRAAPPPLGYDFSEAWPDGPMSEGLGLLRLAPWRLRAADLETLTGQKPAQAWRRATPASRPSGSMARGR